MKKAITILRTIVVSLALASPLTAKAADVVWDPTNFIENLITAIASVQSEITEAASYTQQVRQTYELIRASASMDGLANLAGLSEEYQMYQDLMAVNGQLKNTMNEGLWLTKNLQAQFGAGNFSWERFLRQKQGIDFSRADAFKNQYEYLNRQMRATADRRRAILSKLESAEGQTSATQAVGAQIDVLIGQQQQMISALAQTRQDQEFKVREDEANSAAFSAYNNRIQQEMRQSSERFNVDYAN